MRSSHSTSARANSASSNSARISPKRRVAADGEQGGAVTKSIAEFATRLDFTDLPAQVVHDCKRRIADTIGCAIAAFDEEPVRIARRVKSLVLTSYLPPQPGEQSTRRGGIAPRARPRHAFHHSLNMGCMGLELANMFFVPRDGTAQGRGHLSLVFQGRLDLPDAGPVPLDCLA